MPWITRGLREGIVTTRYPRRRDDYGQDFHATAGVLPGAQSDASSIDRVREVVAACPTGAITRDGSQLLLDRGRCITCGRCVESAPEHFSYVADPEVSVLRRDLLVVPAHAETDVDFDALRAELAGRVQALRRSVHIRHLDCGSDGSEEWEIAALTNPIYDVQRLGIFFTASPRHADILLVTGSGARAMLEPLALTFESMPSPKVVIAVGTDATSGGLLASSYATRGGIGDELPIDVFVPGSPPGPFSILHGILLGIGLLPSEAHR